MKDDFPGLRQDCSDLIGKCNALAVFADECRSAALDGDAGAVEAAVAQIRLTGTALGEFCAAFIFTPKAES